MRLILLISFFSLFLQAQNILVINSSTEVEKYKETIEAFSKSFNKPFKTLDISSKSQDSIKEYLYAEYPDIVYAVGAKAYQYANKYIPEKKIYFSSIVNWKRLHVNNERFGISNELHSGMQLTLIKSIFSGIKTIGVIYSQYTEDVVVDFTQNAKMLGINIVSKKVNKNSIKNEKFDDIVKQSEATMLISDPTFLNDEKAVENLFESSKKYKKPIFAYHELFIKYGAVLAISIDNPTIGRQISAMIQSNIKGEEIKKIQYPAGTKVIFNKQVATQMDLKFSKNISFIATEVIE